MSHSDLSEGRYRAAIIGLGQIGNLFDDDPIRPGIWTHAGAYEASPQVQLVAGADPDPGRVSHFLTRRRGAKGYQDYHAMLSAEPVDLLSVCGPTSLHYEMVHAALGAGLRAIFCEKPLAESVEQAAGMIEACESRGVLLAVNHTRRWEPFYRQAQAMLSDAGIGTLQSLVGYYPGKLYTMGTHLFDLMRFFAGDAEWVCGTSVPSRHEEPNVCGQILFRGGITGLVVSGRDRTNHLFELDLVGSQGRLRLTGDGSHRESARFLASRRYTGYKELSPPDIEAAPDPDTGNGLVRAVADIVTCLRSGRPPVCSGRDGMAALEIAQALEESVRRGNAKIELPLLPTAAAHVCS